MQQHLFLIITNKFYELQETNNPTERLIVCFKIEEERMEMIEGTTLIGLGLGQIKKGQRVIYEKFLNYFLFFPGS